MGWELYGVWYVGRFPHGFHTVPPTVPPTVPTRFPHGFPRFPPPRFPHGSPHGFHKDVVLMAMGFGFCLNGMLEFVKKVKLGKLASSKMEWRMSWPALLLLFVKLLFGIRRLPRHQRENQRFYDTVSVCLSTPLSTPHHHHLHLERGRTGGISCFSSCYDLNVWIDDLKPWLAALLQCHTFVLTPPTPPTPPHPTPPHPSSDEPRTPPTHGMVIFFFTNIVF